MLTETIIITLLLCQSYCYKPSCRVPYLVGLLKIAFVISLIGTIVYWEGETIHIMDYITGAIAVIIAIYLFMHHRIASELEKK